MTCCSTWVSQKLSDACNICWLCKLTDKCSRQQCSTGHPCWTRDSRAADSFRSRENCTSEGDADALRVMKQLHAIYAVPTGGPLPGWLCIRHTIAGLCR